MTIQRFWCEEASNIRCVRESDFDAALAREAALREELERQKRYVEINANSAHGKHKEGQQYKDERDDLQQRLTAAEQRNATLEGLLRECINIPYRDGLLESIVAALNPTESGASE